MIRDSRQTHCYLAICAFYGKRLTYLGLAVRYTFLLEDSSTMAFRIRFNCYVCNSVCEAQQSVRINREDN